MSDNGSFDKVTLYFIIPGLLALLTILVAIFLPRINFAWAG
jgi:hypothetical protein